MNGRGFNADHAGNYTHSIAAGHKHCAGIKSRVLAVYGYLYRPVLNHGIKREITVIVKKNADFIVKYFNLVAADIEGGLAEHFRSCPAHPKPFGRYGIPVFVAKGVAGLNRVPAGNRHYIERLAVAGILVVIRGNYQISITLVIERAGNRYPHFIVFRQYIRFGCIISQEVVACYN